MLALKPHSRPQARACRCLAPSLAACLLVCCLTTPLRAQQDAAFQRNRAETMLHDIVRDVEKHYFDPLALGSGWNASVRATEQKIRAAHSMNAALAEIAALLDSLNDSHTFFLPPARPFRNDYGFAMQMIGDRCYVTRVRPGSDAQAKGLKPGDQILALEGYAPSRQDIWRMKYVYWILEPRRELRLAVRGADGGQRSLEVIAKLQAKPAADNLSGSAMFDAVREMEIEQDALQPRLAERGKALLIARLPGFALSSSELDSLLEKMRHHTAVILDLRGNPGGDQDALESLLGGLFAEKVLIGSAVNSRTSSVIETKPHRHAFTGRLAVLIDSESGSASEVFARAIQLRRRGLVVGDRSAGRTMAASRYLHKASLDSSIVYGASVTSAQIRMSDGQSLEFVGVIPDRTVLPTPGDLAAGRDPQLSAAAAALDVTLSPEEAGTLFPHLASAP